MRYLVTGSAGFIGRHVVGALLAAGHDVVGVDSFTDYYDPARKRANTAALAEHPRFTPLERDLVADPVDDLVAGVDAVIHLAGQPGVRLSWADGFGVYVDRNVNASQRLLEAAHRTRLPRLVMASSSSVYGNATTYPVTEESPTRPFNESELRKVREQLQSFYDDFVEKVARSRQRTPEQIDAVAQGRVWTGRQAKERGLVDELGGLDRAIAIAKERAKIAADQDVEIAVYPRPKSFYELVSEGLSGGSESAMRAWMSANLSSEERAVLRSLRGTAAMFRRGEPLALMPYTYIR